MYNQFITIKPRISEKTAEAKLYIYINISDNLLLGVQKSSELFFVKFNLYSKTNEKILISEIFSVCINNLLPYFGELANSLTIETHRL